MNEMQEGLQEGLKKLAADLAKASPPRYCEAHKPCDAKEHQPGYSACRDMFAIAFGSLTLGLVDMLAVNAGLVDVARLAAQHRILGSIFGTYAVLIMAYALRLIAKR